MAVMHSKRGYTRQAIVARIRSSDSWPGVDHKLLAAFQQSRDVMDLSKVKEIEDVLRVDNAVDDEGQAKLLQLGNDRQLGDGRHQLGVSGVKVKV